MIVIGLFLFLYHTLFDAVVTSRFSVVGTTTQRHRPRVKARWPNENQSNADE